MKAKKLLAVTMAATMVWGSSITVLATNIESATGAGESTGHLATDVVTAILPTSSVDGKFAFTIDPENILDKTKKIKDGTTTVTTNADKVYFANTSESTTTYSSSSDAVKIAAKNYVAADVTVTATVGTAASGKTVIPLAADTNELNAATSPTLLLTLKVGTKSGAITSEGAVVKDTIDAQTSNFNTVWDSTSSKYKLEAKTDESITWEGLNVQLTGKLGGGDTTTDSVVAPTVTLTWSVTAHQNTPAVSMTSGGLITITGLSSDYVFSKLEVPLNGTTYEMNSNRGTWSPVPSATTTGTVTFQLNEAWTTALAGSTAAATLTYVENGTNKTVTSSSVSFE